MVAWAFILGMVLVLPALAMRTAHALDSGRAKLPPRTAVHLNTIVTLAVLLGVALTVARIEEVHLFPQWSPTWVDAAAVAGFLVLMVGILLTRLGKLDAARRERLERVTMSDWRDPRQLGPYTLVCIMAGVAEEIAYRGVLTELLTRATGSHAAAIVVACIAFGAAHAVQGWRSAALAALFAAVFHAMVMLTGDLYAAMIAHATYDLIAGLVIAQHARRHAARRLMATAEPPRPSPEPPAAR